uniref:Iron-containing alcohol dehydrogenase n=1 Tax=Mesoaciditoga lauensis TaxID=1495039 RepID=A0A7V3RFP5_9BACT
MFTHFNPVDLRFGEGAMKSVDFSLYGKKALIVTGKGGSAKRSGAIGDLTGMLDDQKISYDFFNEAEENPSFDTVDKGATFFRSKGCDFIVGVGGGSPMAVAKAISAAAKMNKKVAELYPIKDKISCYPTIAITTTSGTGSEVTQYAVLTSPEDKKLGLRTNRLYPSLAIVDPKYTLTLPGDITISTGLDALSQLVEGILSKASTPLMDILAVRGIEMIKTSLPAVVREPNDIENRTHVAMASTISGIVISQTGTTIVHALGYPITSHIGIRHGLANMMTICQILKQVEKAAPERVKIATSPFGSVNGTCEFIDSIYPRPKLKLKERDAELFTEEIDLKAGQIMSTPGKYDFEFVKALYMSL